MDELEFLALGVPGNVHLGQGLIDHVCARAHQLVNHAGNALFVARNGRGRHDDHIARFDFQFFVLGKRHAGKPAHRLALAARGYNHDFVILVPVDFVDGKQASLGNVQLAQLHGHLRDIDHAAPNEADPALIPHRQIHHLLDPVHVAGKHGHDDAPRRLGEIRIKGIAHRALAHRVARMLGVGGIGQQAEHALAAQLCQAAQIHDLIIDGRVVHLKNRPLCTMTPTGVCSTMAHAPRWSGSP